MPFNNLATLREAEEIDLPKTPHPFQKLQEQQEAWQLSPQVTNYNRLNSNLNTHFAV